MNAEISRLAKWASQARGLPAVPAEALLTALYRSHRLDLIRLAVLLVGDRETAEDIVQDVFARLHGRRPETLTLAYVRTCVLNGSRSVLRRRMVESRWTERGKEALDKPPGRGMATRGPGVRAAWRVKVRRSAPPWGCR
ncbi:sigma factor [Streptosporangium amethystogenes]|uniref:sigma factor n=1 Tax=Streptosporangium amethystogenes TaxID=2002 RepID=UPI0037A8AAE3